MKTGRLSLGILIVNGAMLATGQAPHEIVLSIIRESIFLWFLLLSNSNMP